MYIIPLILVIKLTKVFDGKIIKSYASYLLLFRYLQHLKLLALTHHQLEASLDVLRNVSMIPMSQG